ncbi:hypothetical protein OG252_03875 [Streptomyces sp. NBC_01352]|uniref:hypothetical protein n=1 Tax=Streptomyces sp. NBC_01352 TaxID=2903834 RepID=UPI002E32A0D8|nr:hypothetical protein [Streptomyces sp. NBC_01352]
MTGILYASGVDRVDDVGKVIGVVTATFLVPAGGGGRSVGCGVVALRIWAARAEATPLP